MWPNTIHLYQHRATNETPPIRFRLNAQFNYICTRCCCVFCQPNLSQHNTRFRTRLPRERLRPIEATFPTNRCRWTRQTRDPLNKVDYICVVSRWPLNRAQRQRVTWRRRWGYLGYRCAQKTPTHTALHTRACLLRSSQRVHLVTCGNRSRCSGNSAQRGCFTGNLPLQVCVEPDPNTHRYTFTRRLP